MTLKQAIAFGVIFGLTAAVIVWYLERFELNRLHAEVREYLGKRDAFGEFLQERGMDEPGTA